MFKQKQTHWFLCSSRMKFNLDLKFISILSHQVSYPLITIQSCWFSHMRWMDDSRISRQMQCGVNWKGTGMLEIMQKHFKGTTTETHLNQCETYAYCYQTHWIDEGTDWHRRMALQQENLIFWDKSDKDSSYTNQRKNSKCNIYRWLID